MSTNALVEGDVLVEFATVVQLAASLHSREVERGESRMLLPIIAKMERLSSIKTRRLDKDLISVKPPDMVSINELDGPILR